MAMRPTVKRRRLGRPPLATRSLSRDTRPPSLDRIRLLAACEQDGGSEAHGADHDRNGNLPGGAIGHPVRAVQVALEARRGGSRVAVVVAVKGQVRGSQERGPSKSEACQSDRQPPPDRGRLSIGAICAICCTWSREQRAPRGWDSLTCFTRALVGAAIWGGVGFVVVFWIAVVKSGCLS